MADARATYIQGDSKSLFQCKKNGVGSNIFKIGLGSNKLKLLQIYIKDVKSHESQAYWFKTRRTNRIKIKKIKEKKELQLGQW